jgi:multiple sugar transport system permease protein
MAGIPPTSAETRVADAAAERKLTSQAQAVSGVRRRSFMASLADSLGSFLFVVPYLLFFIAFLFGPLVYAFILSLHKWDTLTGDLGFIGLSHYQTFLFDSADIHFHDFYQALGNTALFTVITVPLLVGVGLILALLVAEAPGQSFWRSLFYIPNVLSVSVVGALWLWIFQTGGIVDTYVHNKNLDWLANQPWAWMVLIITTLWWTVGGAMVILLAGVVEVPKDYHEAAKIDGANGLQRILYITVPILRPILAFVSITTMLASVSMVGQSLLITNGGPNQSTQTIFLYIYNEGFGRSNLGTAAAMSFVVGLIMVVISVMALRFFRASET